MKVSEMNENQKKVWRLAVDNVNELIGGYENTMEDYSEDSEEYQHAKSVLELPHEDLVNIVFGWCRASREWKSIENLHLVGFDFLRERISNRLKKYGY